MLLFISPVSAKTFYDVHGGIDNVIQERKLYGFQNKDYEKVLSFIYNDSGQIIKIYTTLTLLGEPISLLYDKNGKLIYYDVFRVKYDKNGKILKLSPLDKIIYNDAGQIIKIGKYNIDYDESGKVVKLHRNIPILDEYIEYYPYYSSDSNKFNEFYEKMIADRFFNKYKNKLKKYNTYEGFYRNIAMALQNELPNSEIEKYIEPIDKFNKIYNKFITEPIKYNSLDEDDKNWFQEQVKQTENWMKTHNSNYENPYEKKYKISPEAIISVKPKAKPKTETELLQEEIKNLKKEIKNLKEEISSVERNGYKPEKIYSIGGKRVEYSGNRIYSIGGERVQY